MTTKSTDALLVEYEAIVQQLKDRTRDDEALRLQALTISQEAQRAFETPYDMICRHTWSPLDLIVLAVACDLNIFKTLSRAGTMKLVELNAELQVDPVLLKRIMMYLVVMATVDMKDSDTYVANACTRDYSGDGRIGNIRSQMLYMHTYLAMPQLLKETRYQEPTDTYACAWQLGNKTTEDFYGTLNSNAATNMHFNNWMNAPCPLDDKVLVADLFPSEELFAGSGHEDILFVDVGGGQGRQAMNLRKTYPRSRGRIIVEDLAQVVETIDPKTLPDIELLHHDMFEPQVVEAARVYYFRRILHGHADVACRKFLSHTVKAMKPYSRILINDVIIGDMGAAEHAVRQDCAMMGLVAGRERTETHMKELLSSVGLEVIAMKKYHPQGWYLTEAKLC